MENKYKLIKAFPGRKEVGLEVTFGNWGLTGECYQGKVVNTTVRYSKEAIENFPEFWEKVKTTDYKILTITRRGVDYNLNSRGHYNTPPIVEYSLEALLSEDNGGISKVQRISDGVIFKVGDEVLVKNTEQKPRKIRGFIVSTSYKDQIGVSIDDKFDKAYSGDMGCPLSVCTVYNKPVLFVTKDGVQVYEGDSYYYKEKSYAV
jgi:hypothetical protein